jgi:hypothetical protein
LVNKSAGKFQLFPGLRFHSGLDPESGGKTLDPGFRRDDVALFVFGMADG